MPASRRVRAVATSLLVLAGSLAGPLPTFAASQPSAQEILRLVRATESNQNRDMAGRLWMSTENGKLEIPFHLAMRGSTVTYQFSNPSEALVLHLGERGSRLERVTGSGKSQTVSGAKLDAPVRGTDVTYEDLALKFVYWNNATVVGEDNRGISHCWVVQVVRPGKESSQYEIVRLWIEKSGGLLKAECYSHGKLAKRFEVKKVQKAPGGGYMLKLMSVERPGKEAPTYLGLDPA